MDQNYRIISLSLPAWIMSGAKFVKQKEMRMFLLIEELCRPFPRRLVAWRRYLFLPE